ncbi:hypothetical protein SAMN05880582_10643 [Rhizobium sp. RU20A]|uniref:hypothetical protein n=1 Tax=Rhizobium sp. RU20A TaxID=1907412 RepID=UPI0009575382|nr:hypothetical protein [Rhizobium sp. RU20A]SIR06463.1 hypothetical protein SAMN05880582_10643 [Rhizobium sp. RU20A]
MSGAPFASGRQGDGHADSVARNGSDAPLVGLAAAGQAVDLDWLAVLAGQTRASFSCDLTSGAYTLSDAAAALHGLQPDTRGIMDIVNAYAHDTRDGVLATLERATGKPMMFGYRARRADGETATAIACVGRSLADAGGRMCLLRGYFLSGESLPDERGPDGDGSEADRPRA